MAAPSESAFRQATETSLLSRSQLHPQCPHHWRRKRLRCRPHSRQHPRPHPRQQPPRNRPTWLPLLQPRQPRRLHALRTRDVTAPPTTRQHKKATEE